MNAYRPNPTARFAIALCLAASAVSAAPARAADVAGWVEPDPATQVVPVNAFSLTRAGKSIAYTDAGLHACDKLTLVDDKVIVLVRLASNLRMHLDVNSPGRQIEVPCNQRGIGTDLAAAIRAMLRGIEQRKVRVAAITRSIAPLDVPALAGPQTHLVAGKRALYVAWTGGTSPFTVQLAGSDGRELTARSDVESRFVRLAAVELLPGQYTLWVRNRAGHRIEGIRDDAVFVVSEGALPAMPEVLKDIALGDEARALFYADYLVAQEDGRWTFEALQRVAALSGKSEAVRQWLHRYGGSD